MRRSARRSCLILAASALLLASCTPTEERLAAHIERGEELLAQGRSDSAFLEFQSALNLAPDDAALLERLADLLFERNQFGEALLYYERAYDLDPSRIRSAMQQARLLAVENTVRAQQLLDEALARSPDVPIVQRARSHLALVRKKIDEAEEAADRAVELDPEDADSWVQQAAVQVARLSASQQLRREPDPAVFGRAIAAYEKADELRGGDPRVRMHRGRVLGLAGRSEEAAASYRSALDLAVERGVPIEIRNVAREVDAYGRHSRDPELREYALETHVAAVEDAYEAWEDLGRLVEGQPDRSGEEVYLRLLGRRPRDPRAHELYVTYLTRKGRLRAAELHLGRTLMAGVDEPALHAAMIEVQLQRGRRPEARHHLGEAQKRHADAPEVREASARLAMVEQRYEEAVETLLGLAQEQETSERMRLLALVYYHLERLPEATRALARASELAPGNVGGIVRLEARLHVASERWPEALKSFRVLAAAREPLTVEEHALLATTLYEVGQRAGGRKILDSLLASAEPSPEVALAFARLEGERDPERAYGLLAAAQELVPGHPSLLEQLTERDLAAGRIEPALERLSAVVEARQATPRTLLLRARTLSAGGAYEYAEADVLRAFEADPSLPGAIDLLYSLYQVQGKLEEARRSFEQAEDAGVLHTGARLLLARMYLGDRETERARAMLERVVAEDPSLWRAQNDLAAVLAMRGEELERALELASSAHKASGESPTTADTVGFVHLKAGRASAAVRQFRSAIAGAEQTSAAAADMPTFRYHLGLALRALGREDEAARAFEAALVEGEFPEAEDARRQLEAARHAS